MFIHAPQKQPIIVRRVIVRRNPIRVDETYPIIGSFNTNFESKENPTRRVSLGNGFFVSEKDPGIPEFG
jgi:hypothetical protein